MSGEAAEAIEKQPAGDAVAEALAVLRSIFEPQGVRVPTPLQVGVRHTHLCDLQWARLTLHLGSLSELESKDM